MKRLASLLIIAAFFLAICGGAGGLVHAKPKAYSGGQDGPQFSILLPNDDCNGKPDVVGQATQPDSSIPFLGFPGETFFSFNEPSYTPLDEYFFRGLGCGGLPA